MCFKTLTAENPLNNWNSARNIYAVISTMRSCQFLSIHGISYDFYFGIYMKKNSLHSMKRCLLQLEIKEIITIIVRISKFKKNRHEKSTEIVNILLIVVYKFSIFLIQIGFFFSLFIFKANIMIQFDIF